jgi:dipeptidyl aminopeptidase/acylaminoacyl peptidase
MREVLGGAWFSRPGPALLLIALLVLIGGSSAGGLAQKPDSGRGARHVLSLADLPEIKVFEEVAVSNDGRWAAYTMSRPLPGGHRSERGEVTVLDLQRKTRHVVELEGEARGLTWSPIGTTLAFMAPSKGPPRIWLYSPSNRSVGARLLSGNDTLSQDVQAIGWSPNGSEIGFLAKGPRAAGADSAKVSPRVVLFRDEPNVITETTSEDRPDSVGLYLGITSIEAGSSRLVTRSLVTAQGWLPTVQWVGAGLVVEGAPLGVPSPRLLIERRLSLVDPHTGRARVIGPDSPARLRAALPPSGRAMAYLDYEYITDRPRVAGVFSLRLSQIAQPESTSAASTSEIDGLISTLPPIWADEATLYIGRLVNATPRLYAVDLPSRRWRQLTPDTLSVSAYATAPNGKVLLPFWRTPINNRSSSGLSPEPAC